MNRFTLLLGIGIFLFSCNNDLKKSVYEPLSQEVIDRETQKNSTFKSFYETVRIKADTIYNPIDSFPQFLKLEYGTLWELEKEMSKRIDELENDFKRKEEWDNQFLNDIEKFRLDSIKFRNLIRENYYKNFVRIEVKGVETKIEWGNTMVYVPLEFTPINNNIIRKIGGSLSFVPIGDKYDTLSFAGNTSKLAAFFSFTGNTKGKFKNTASTVSKEFYGIEGLPIEIIQQKYNIVFHPTELVIEDRFVDVSMSEIPYIFRRYLETNDSFDKEFYIKEYLNKDYKSYKTFVDDLVTTEMRNKFPLEVEFYLEGWAEYYKRKFKY